MVGLCCVSSLLSNGALAFIAYRFVQLLYRLLYPYYLGTPVDLQKKAGGKWAVVTGATDGIGKAYAFELAARSFNVLLVSRTQTKLDETKKEILEKHPKVEIQTFAFDFSARDDSAYQPLVDVISKLEVGVLVNNVGMSFEYPDTFHEWEGGVKRLTDVTAINTIPTVLLCAAVLPSMAARRSGVIVNLSSGAGYNIMPFWSVYSASKRFVLHLSEILDAEYASKGVTIQAICPMLVATKMSKIRRTSFFGPDATRFVQAAIKTIGLIQQTTGYFSHQLQAELMGLLPDALVTKIIASHSLAVRTAALKKLAKEN